MQSPVSLAPSLFWTVLLSPPSPFWPFPVSPLSVLACPVTPVLLNAPAVLLNAIVPKPAACYVPPLSPQLSSVPVYALPEPVWWPSLLPPPVCVQSLSI